MKHIHTTLVLFICLQAPFFLNAQGEMKAVDGYTPQIGYMVYMLEDLKNKVENQVKDLDQSQTDFVYDSKANSIGALGMHLVSTEMYYQLQTLGESNWTEAEQKLLQSAGDLNQESKSKLKGKPITYYLELWDKVRQQTLKGLKSKDDAWFAENIDEGINNHYVWYHVMQHTANHNGQIASIKNRLPKED